MVKRVDAMLKRQKQKKKKKHYVKQRERREKKRMLKENKKEGKFWKPNYIKSLLCNPPYYRKGTYSTYGNTRRDFAFVE